MDCVRLPVVHLTVRRSLVSAVFKGTRARKGTYSVGQQGTEVRLQKYGVAGDLWSEILRFTVIWPAWIKCSKPGQICILELGGVILKLSIAQIFDFFEIFEIIAKFRPALFFKKQSRKMIHYEFQMILSIFKQQNWIFCSSWRPHHKLIRPYLQWLSDSVRPTLDLIYGTGRVRQLQCWCPHSFSALHVDE